ncbi:MAG: hypothetical protein ACI9DF_001053 [Verrucomicrobiales bacterium]
MSMNALESNRDDRRPLQEIGERENGLPDRTYRGRRTVCLPKVRENSIVTCVATQTARYAKLKNNQAQGESEMRNHSCEDDSIKTENLT